jgi:hypothetical protein
MSTRKHASAQEAQQSQPVLQAEPEAAMNGAAAANGAAPPLDGLGIDLAALRLDQNYVETAGVEKVLTTVPIRKPLKTEFVRTHPEWHFDTMILDLKDEGEVYFAPAHLLTEVGGIAVPVSLRPTISRLGVLFLWPVRLPMDDRRRDNAWHISAREAAALAHSRWISLRANRALGAYEILQGASTLSEPVWPGKTLEEILEVAFRGRIINDYTHPVLRSLRGEM